MDNDTLRKVQLVLLEIAKEVSYRILIDSTESMRKRNGIGA